VAATESEGAGSDRGSDGGGGSATPSDGDGGPGGGPDDGPDDGPGDGPADGPDDGPADGPNDSTGETTSGESGEPPVDEVEQMCARWTADRSDLSEGSWSGDVGTCESGDTSETGRANALRLVNLYRWMADLPEVSDEASRNEGAQDCALIMDANNSLSHDPPMGWSCWSSSGASAAGSSNISSGQGVLSVDMYMVDFGNASTLGHRRWIMSNSLGPIGLGSTSGSSCMHVIGGNGSAGASWTAYPSPGPFPLEAFDILPFGDTLDQTGWSVQSDSIELGGASASITANGEDRPVSVTTLSPGYGSGSAISLIPQGWTAQPDTNYHVEVVAGGETISYDVYVVDC